RLQDVGVEETALGLPALRQLPHARTTGRDEEGHVVRGPGAPRRDEIRETESLARGLARKGERLDHAPVGTEEDDGIALGLHGEALVDRARRHGARGQDLVLDGGPALPPRSRSCSACTCAAIASRVRSSASLFARSRPFIASLA